VQELDVTAKGEEQGQAVADFNQILGSIWDMSGLGAKVVHDLKDAFTRAGLQNVCVHRLALPVGRKLENEGHCAASLEPHGLLIPNIVQGAKGNVKPVYYKFC
jgi:hypothetical protein